MQKRAKLVLLLAVLTFGVSFPGVPAMARRGRSHHARRGHHHQQTSHKRKATSKQQAAREKEIKAIEQRYAKLNKQLLSNLKLTPDERDAIKADFIDYYRSQSTWKATTQRRIQSLQAQLNEAKKAHNTQAAASLQHSLKVLKDKAPTWNRMLEKMRSELTPAQQAKFDQNMKKARHTPKAKHHAKKQKKKR